jgi:cytochrome P450
MSAVSPGTPNVVHDETHGIFVVADAREVEAVLRDDARFSAGTLGQDSFELRAPGDAAPLPARDTLLASDSPVHPQLRRQLGAAFSARSVARLEATARAETEVLLMVLWPFRTCDVIDDVCVPVGVAVMTALLGLEANRRPDVARWMRVCALCNAQSRPPWLKDSFEDMLRELSHTLASLPVTEEPGLLASLVAARERGELQPAQVLDLAVTVMKGAADTTCLMVGNALLAAQREAREGRPPPRDGEALTLLLESSLRRDAPVQLTVREALEDVWLSGVRIPKGARLLLRLGAASSGGQKHGLAFGAGGHRCPGAGLAMMQARVILEALWRMPGGFRVDADAMQPHGLAALRGPRHLPLRW